MTISLDYEQKGILRYLDTRKGDPITLEDINDYLKNQEYGKLTKKELRDKIDELIDVGYVRSNTGGERDGRKERFYLSKLAGGLLGGVSKKRSLQGRGPWHDTSKLVKRLLSCFFILSLAASFFFLSPSFTGNAIGNVSESNSSLISFGLFIFALVCGFLYFKRK